MNTVEVPVKSPYTKYLPLSVIGIDIPEAECPELMEITVEKSNDIIVGNHIDLPKATLDCDGHVWVVFEDNSSMLCTYALADKILSKKLTAFWMETNLTAEDYRNVEEILTQEGY